MAKRTSVDKRRAPDLSDQETNAPVKKKHRRTDDNLEIAATLDAEEGPVEEGTPTRPKPTKTSKRKRKSVDSRSSSEDEIMSTRSKKKTASGKATNPNVNSTTGAKHSKGDEQEVSSGEEQQDESEEKESGHDDDDGSSSEEFKLSAADHDSADESEDRSWVEGTPKKAKKLSKPKKPPSPKLKKARFKLTQKPNRKQVAAKNVKGPDPIWTKGYEVLDESLGIVPGERPDWEPFIRNDRGGKTYQWEVNPKGKEWLQARFNDYSYPEPTTEHEERRADYDARCWRSSLANAYHSLWPNIDLTEYGEGLNPRTAKRRVVDYLGRLQKKKEKAKAEVKAKSLDKFFASLFADRRRPRAYDLWAGDHKDDDNLKIQMDKQLMKMYGSTRQGLNERNAARRQLFEKLPKEEQEDYKFRAKKWIKDSKKPTVEEMPAWIPAAFNALGDMVEKKAHWINMTLTGGRGPDGEIYYFIDEYSSHTRGTKVPLVAREAGVAMRRVWVNYVAEILGDFTGFPVESKDVRPLQLAATDADAAGVSPPDLEYDSSFSKLADDLSIERILAEVIRYLNETWLKVPFDRRKNHVKPPWKAILQIEDEKKYAQYFEPQRVPNLERFGDPSNMKTAALKELALHLVRSCLDPSLEPEKRFRWTHQVDDEANEESDQEDGEDNEDLKDDDSKDQTPTTALETGKGAQKATSGKNTKASKGKGTAKPTQKATSSDDKDKGLNDENHTSVAPEPTANRTRSWGPAGIKKKKKPSAAQAPKTQSPPVTVGTEGASKPSADKLGRCETPAKDNKKHPSHPNPNLTPEVVVTPPAVLFRRLSATPSSKGSTKPTSEIDHAVAKQKPIPKPPSLAPDDTDDELIAKGLGHGGLANEEPPSTSKSGESDKLNEKGSEVTKLSSPVDDDKVEIIEVGTQSKANKHVRLKKAREPRKPSRPTRVADDSDVELIDEDLGTRGNEASGQTENTASHQSPDSEPEVLGGVEESSHSNPPPSTTDNAQEHSEPAGTQHSLGTVNPSGTDSVGLQQEHHEQHVNLQPTKPRKEKTKQGRVEKTVEPRTGHEAVPAVAERPSVQPPKQDIPPTEKRRPLPRAINGVLFGYESSVPAVAPGQSKGDLVIKQIFRDPQPPLRLKNPMDNIGNQVFITRTPTSIAEFEASGGWNAQRYELQTMPPLKDIVVKFINLQPYLWATRPERWTWMEGADFDSLDPVPQEYLRQLGNSALGMPNLSQWNEETTETRIVVMRHGVGHVVNGLTEWIRTGCEHSPNNPRGGLWSVLRVIDWLVRVSQLSDSLISPDTPHILVPWLHSSLMAALWITRGSRMALRKIPNPISDTAQDLTHNLKRAWLKYSTLFAINNAPHRSSFYKRSWVGEGELPAFANEDISLLLPHVPVSSVVRFVLNEGYSSADIRSWLTKRLVALDNCNAAQLGQVVFIFLAHVKSLDGTDTSDWCIGYGNELGAHLMRLANQNTVITAPSARLPHAANTTPSAQQTARNPAITDPGSMVFVKSGSQSFAGAVPAENSSPKVAVAKHSVHHPPLGANDATTAGFDCSNPGISNVAPTSNIPVDKSGIGHALATVERPAQSLPSLISADRVANTGASTGTTKLSVDSVDVVRNTDSSAMLVNAEGTMGSMHVETDVASLSVRTDVGEPQRGGFHQLTISTSTPKLADGANSSPSTPSPSSDNPSAVNDFERAQGDANQPTNTPTPKLTYNTPPSPSSLHQNYTRETRPSPDPSHSSSTINNPSDLVLSPPTIVVNDEHADSLSEQGKITDRQESPGEGSNDGDPTTIVRRDTYITPPIQGQSPALSDLSSDMQDGVDELDESPPPTVLQPLPQTLVPARPTKGKQTKGRGSKPGPSRNSKKPERTPSPAAPTEKPARRSSRLEKK